ncbi:MAG: hypothetical protein Solivirus1_29 [Solivirus sp.]|uniref:Uncharacterized protein n=1 Tax=Solivirus sp. TaxID=2487772 RepID=A0A3G5AFC1_9VIRU|nr:MAG: hypothetical protein Solivirus1_29 [Solivirus sp.]
MTEVGELFDQLYNTDIYLANRALVDFDQEVIDQLEISGKYSKLFTESLQTDLYRKRLSNLVDFETLEKLTDLHRRYNIPWSKIYRITEIASDEDLLNYIFESLHQIAKRDDVDALRILENFINLSYYVNDSSRVLLNLFEKNKSKKIISYILTNYQNIDTDSLFRLVFAISKWNDLESLREFVPIIQNRLNEILQNREDVMRGVTGSIFGASNSAAAILYLLEIGFHFNGIEMTFIAKNPETKYLIPTLLQHGAPAVNMEMKSERNKTS